MTTKQQPGLFAVKTLRSGAKVITDHCDKLYEDALTLHLSKMRERSVELVKDLEKLLRQARDLRDELRAEK